MKKLSVFILGLILFSVSRSAHADDLGLILFLFIWFFIIVELIAMIVVFVVFIVRVAKRRKANYKAYTIFFLLTMILTPIIILLTDIMSSSSSDIFGEYGALGKNHLQISTMSFAPIVIFSIIALIIVRHFARNAKKLKEK